LEIDWKWEEQLRCQICHSCKDKYPEKYSLLTKTEAREDYLLTDRESDPYFQCLLPVLFY
jgi:DNA-repair protein complementing XP-A cells